VYLTREQLLERTLAWARSRPDIRAICQLCPPTIHMGTAELAKSPARVVLLGVLTMAGGGDGVQDSLQGGCEKRSIGYTSVGDQT